MLPMRSMRSRAQHCKAVGGLPPQAWYVPYARGTRPWKQLPICIVCMLSEAPAESAEASMREEERIRARIEVVGPDNYSSRTKLEKERAMSNSLVGRPGAGNRWHWYSVKVGTLSAVALIVLVSLLHPSSFNGI